MPLEETAHADSSGAREGDEASTSAESRGSNETTSVKKGGKRKASPNVKKAVHDHSSATRRNYEFNT